MHARAISGMERAPVSAALLLCAVVARAEPPLPVGTTVNEALASCDAADAAPIPDRIAILSQGLRRAEEAVRANPEDAVAHFAVFCHLGKRAELRRRAVGVFAIVGDIVRARREIDTTLALAPNYPAALAAKGQMLKELPRLLGGDPDEGDRLLRLAVTLDPADPRMRLLASQRRVDDRR
jgi:hypothetical protein